MLEETERNYKKTLWPLFMDGLQLLQDQSHFEEAFYFITFYFPGALFINLARMKGRVDLGAIQCFDHKTPGLGIQHLNRQYVEVIPQFSKMLDRKKENHTVCSSLNSHSNLLNNVFASVHYLSFNIKLLFLPKILGVSLTLCQKILNIAGGIFYQLVRT